MQDSMELKVPQLEKTFKHLASHLTSNKKHILERSCGLVAEYLTDRSKAPSFIPHTINTTSKTTTSFTEAASVARHKAFAELHMKPWVRFLGKQ